ncbi:MAG: hypothetical protein V3S45_00030 [Kiloniellales bacterium]
MSGIEQLQQRVQDAEQRFGLIHEQGQKYSERLISLIIAIEDYLRDLHAQVETAKTAGAHQDAEITRYKSELARIDQENEQLRKMLHSLLQAVEAGNSESLLETMQMLETKVSALVSPGLADAARPADAAQPTDTAQPAAPPPVSDPLRVEAPDPAEGLWPSVEPAPRAETPASESMYAAGEADGTFQTISEASISLESDFPPTAAAETTPPQAPSDPATEEADQIAAATAAMPATGADLENDTQFEQADIDAATAAAREIAAKYAPNSRSLGEIMDRVSRLVQENANAAVENAPGQPATEAPDLKVGTGGT